LTTEETIALRKKGLPTVPASLSVEKQTNPFLRINNPNVIVAAEAHSGRRHPRRTPPLHRRSSQGMGLTRHPH